MAFASSRFDVPGKSTDVVPAVNQVESSPFIQRRELTAYCRERGIVVESYSTLGRGRRTSDERLADVGSPYGKTPAQVALRWALQAGFVVIPKSVHSERILENAAVFDFELSDSDMERIAGFDENATVMPSDWDPETSEKWR